MLAAPAFAAAALGQRRDVIFPVGRRVVLFTEITVGAGSAAVGRETSGLAEPRKSRVLAWADATGRWSWEPSPRRLIAGDQLAVVATRSGLARLLRATRAVVAPSPPVARPG
jgi:hypothetical protein